jgi:hypothetical protein
LLALLLINEKYLYICLGGGIETTTAFKKPLHIVEKEGPSWMLFPQKFNGKPIGAVG